MVEYSRDLTAEDAYRYWLLLNQSADAVFIMDQEGKLIEFSEHTCALLGYPPEDMGGLTVFDWDPDITKEEYAQIVSSLTEQPVRFERRHRRKDGSIYFVDIAAAKFAVGNESVIYATARDISEAKTLAQKVEEQHKELNAIFEHVAEGIAIVNPDGRIRRVNRFLAELLGTEASSLTGRRICEFLSEDDAASWRSLIDDVMSTANRQWFEVGLGDGDKNVRYLRFSVSQAPNVEHLLIGAVDVTADHRYRKSLLKNAVTDELTGLPNRRAFRSAVTHSIRHYRRQGMPFALLIGDLDDFKAINDRLGHLEGDRVLKDTACVLTSRLRNKDYCFRIGGEEFAILLADTHRADALAVAESLRHLIYSSVTTETLPVTISIGVAQMAERDTFDTLFEKADRRLYAAKKNGKNRVMYSAENVQEV